MKNKTIISIYPYMTLKASPLNNPSVRRTCGKSEGWVLSERVHRQPSWATPFRADTPSIYVSGGATHTPTIER